MVPFILFVVLVIQIVLNKLMDDKRVLNGRIFVLIAILLLYIIVLPYVFTRLIPVVEDHQCGLPIIALLASFWIFGTLITIITHIIYSLVNGKQKIYPDD